jgi:hypothetical protein
MSSLFTHPHNMTIVLEMRGIQIAVYKWESKQKHMVITVPGYLPKPGWILLVVFGPIFTLSTPFLTLGIAPRHHHILLVHLPA